MEASKFIEEVASVSEEAGRRVEAIIGKLRAKCAVQELEALDKGDAASVLFNLFGWSEWQFNPTAVTSADFDREKANTLFWGSIYDRLRVKESFNLPPLVVPPAPPAVPPVDRFDRFDRLLELSSAVVAAYSAGDLVPDGDSLIGILAVEDLQKFIVDQRKEAAR